MSKTVLDLLNEIDDEIANTANTVSTIKKPSDDILFSPYPYTEQSVIDSIVERLRLILAKLESIESVSLEDTKDIVFIKLCIKFISERNNSLTKISIDKLNKINERLK